MLSLAGCITTLFMFPTFWKVVRLLLDAESRHRIIENPEGIFYSVILIGMWFLVGLSTVMSVLWAWGMWTGRPWVRLLTLVLAPMVLAYILPSLGGALLEHIIVAFFSVVGLWALWLAWGDKRAQTWLNRS